MENAEFLDNLNRAFEMEEIMAGHLIDLCRAESLPRELSEQDRAYFNRVLTGIRKETHRHRQTVLEIINRLTEQSDV